MGLITILVEALVIVASELVEDPLLQSMSEQASDDAVVVLIADDPALTAGASSPASGVARIAD